MIDVLKRFLVSFSPPQEPQLSETERLIAEIEEAKQKMACAWNRLDNAAPEYVEITVLELLVLETQYSLLNKRYRLLTGLSVDSTSPIFGPSSVNAPPFSLEGQLQNHVFYGSILGHNTENHASESPQLISPN
ncbi:MAG: hypothetical protein Q8912_16140 [Bacillota bacterium]|nr:hypothetical protein [Bacillota bacterium]MDP4159908.1 hypothetical protein [Bacillota bacterium]